MVKYPQRTVRLDITHVFFRRIWSVARIAIGGMRVFRLAAAVAGIGVLVSFKIAFAIPIAMGMLTLAAIHTHNFAVFCSAAVLIPLTVEINIAPRNNEGTFVYLTIHRI